MKQIKYFILYNLLLSSGASRSAGSALSLMFSPSFSLYDNVDVVVVDLLSPAESTLLYLLKEQVQ